MSDKTKLVRRLEKLLPTALADQVAEEVVDSLWLAEHDEEVRAGVVAEEPEWEYGVIGPTGRVVNNGDYTREQKLRRRKAGPWESGCFGHCDPEGWFTPCRVPVKQEGATDA